MSKSRKQQVEVEGLLNRSGVTKAPVPVQQIAQDLNIEVRFSPTREDVSGALVVKGGAAFIAVNDAHHENRQRFTIAHEIGHFYLHDPKEGAHFDEDFAYTVETANPLRRLTLRRLKRISLLQSS